jgi:geranylgeranyl diphosphate synthase type II
MGFSEQLHILLPLLEEHVQSVLSTPNGSPEGLYEPARYLLGLGGKRLRPALSIWVAQHHGSNFELALPAGLAVEVFHNFSLMHDDIMDEAPVRRGLPTVHLRNGLPTAILSGDAMLVVAYQQLMNYPDPLRGRLMTHFLQTSLEVCEGQQWDMEFQSQKEVSKEEYLNMIRLKTSVLLGEAARMGALVAAATQDVADSWYRFAVAAGLAFQIQDDLLDCYGDSQKTGKQAGGDILANKKTLLAILAWENSNGSQRVEAQFIGDLPASVEKIERTLEWYRMTDAKKRVEAERDRFLNDALKELSNIEGDTSLFEEMAKLFAYRDH